MIRVIFTQVIDGRVRTFAADGRPGESFEGREFMQQYGFASLPQEGASGVIVYNGNHIIAVASDDPRCRPELQAGESVMFDDLGQRVHLTRNGIVIQANVITIEGHTEVDGHTKVKTGASGTFTSKTGQVITVRNGIVVGIDG